MTKKVYSAPWGRRVWLFTGSLLLVGIVLALVLPFLFRKEGEPWIVSFIPTIMMFLIFGGTSLFLIRGYEVMDDKILVRRSFWTDSIDLMGLTSIEADSQSCKGAFKTIGNDGLFAMHGRFRSKKLGNFRAFVTNPQNGVILRFEDRTIVVSPDRPKSFVHEVTRRLRKLEGQT